MKLHEKLLKLRRELNLTQEDLAEKLGVSRQAISRWEMGQPCPIPRMYYSCPSCTG